MADLEHEAREPEAESRGGKVAGFVRVFIEEPTLWPVLVVLIAHAAAFIAPVLLLGLRDGGTPSRIAVAGLALLTGIVGYEESRSRGRPGAITGLVLVIWALSIGLAWVADLYGVF